MSKHLAERGLIDESRGKRIAELAWPRFLTMLARSSLGVADISMVGLTIGSGAIAGLAFATVYWQVAVSFSLGIAGGTIGVVSQNFGADRLNKVDLAIKQSFWLGLALTLPFFVTYWLFPGDLIGILTQDSDIARYGATYLQLVSIALLFIMVNLISSRALAGADDTWIPMTIRSTGAVVNIVLNAAFIFGLNMGVVGAALGSVVAEGLVSVCFIWGFITGRVPVVGKFPITVTLGPPYIDLSIARGMAHSVPPLIAQKLGKVVVRFPLFAILAVFGPTVVSAFEVGRRVRKLLNAFGAGFSMSASSVVGQELGRDEPSLAMDYAQDTTVFSGFVYLTAGIIIFLLAPLVAQLFVTAPSDVAQTATFIRVGTISFVGLGLFRSAGGVLKAAGDNRWIMYGRLSGLYLSLLPLSYLGTISELGIVGVYIAIIGETWLAAVITGYRAISGKWLAIGKQYQVS